MKAFREDATECMIRGFCVVEGVSHPRVVNSFVIRRKIVESGTREPAFMRDSAWVPGIRKSAVILWRSHERVVPSGVRLRTLSLKRSPELIEAS